LKSLLHTLLELGHNTSQNLEFAQQKGVAISFGEETITETNLLEIRRRHADQVRLQTFTKAAESRITGADWEWHFIGDFYTFKMRVQAKRVHRAGGISRLNQQGKHASAPQIDLLISDAKKHNLYPAYCFYCSEPQRTVWKVTKAAGRQESAEAGCLIANAGIVKKIMPQNLVQVEKACVPWHFIIFPQLFSLGQHSYFQRYYKENQEWLFLDRVEAVDSGKVDAEPSFPNLGLLNRKDWLGKGTGIHPTEGPEDGTMMRSYFAERGISKLMTIDVREPYMLFVGR
jgi:hypothetical protein